MSGQNYNRSIIALLGIICVCLVIVFLWSFSNYSNIIREQDSTIVDLTSQLGDTTELDTLNTQIENLENQVVDLTEIVNLEKSSIWGTNNRIINADSYLSTYSSGDTNYAGYLAVKIESSSVDTVYVRVMYSSYGLNYDEQKNVGVGETTIFPILPTQNVEVRIGNPNPTQATISDTITYFY